MARCEWRAISPQLRNKRRDVPRVDDWRRDGSRCGAIVVSSAAAFRSSSDNWACYAATKAFAVNFAQSLAAELQHDPVDILVLCPIYTATGFFARAGYPQPDKAMTPEEVARETMEALGRRTVHIFGLNRAINRLSAQSRQFIMLLLARNPDLAFWHRAWTSRNSHAQSDAKLHLPDDHIFEAALDGPWQGRTIAVMLRHAKADDIGASRAMRLAEAVDWMDD